MLPCRRPVIGRRRGLAASWAQGGSGKRGEISPPGSRLRAAGPHPPQGLSLPQLLLALLPAIRLWTSVPFLPLGASQTRCFCCCYALRQTFWNEREKGKCQIRCYQLRGPPAPQNLWVRGACDGGMEGVLDGEGRGRGGTLRISIHQKMPRK